MAIDSSGSTWPSKRSDSGGCWANWSRMIRGHGPAGVAVRCTMPALWPDDTRGDLILLEDQDRNRWDAGLLTEGLGLLDQVLRAAHPGRTSSKRRSPPSTPWPPERLTPSPRRFAALYAESLRLRPSPTYESIGSSPSPWPTARTPGCTAGSAGDARRAATIHLLAATGPTSSGGPAVPRRSHRLPPGSGPRHQRRRTPLPPPPPR